MSTEARRMRAFGALAAICVVGAAIVVIAGSTSAGRREKASAKAVAAARPSVEKVLAGREPFIVFRDLDRADPQNFSRLSIAPLVDGRPGARLLAGPACDRVAFGAGTGLCLGPPNVGSFDAIVLDSRMRVAHCIRIAGLASRARISPDGRWGGVTAFVSGHSYAETGAFSTMATMIDMRTGKKVGDIEHDFRVRRDGQVVDARDRNFWGLTFAADGDTFYAFLGTGGHTYLIRGSIRARTAETLHENVECPSLSPDGTRIAYKKAVGHAKGAHNPVLWRFTVLDLATARRRRWRRRARSTTRSSGSTTATSCTAAPTRPGPCRRMAAGTPLHGCARPTRWSWCNRERHDGQKTDHPFAAWMRRRYGRAMAAPGARTSHGRTTMTDRPSFELKRFTWAAPDRLDLAGVFTGLGDEHAGEPTLVVNGAGGAHRLPAVAGSVSGSPAGAWNAEFAWQEVPVAFEEASLEFEGGIKVELPQPGTKRTLRRHVIEVQVPNGDGAEPKAVVAEEPPAAAPAEPPVASAEGLRLQAALLAAEENAREAETAARRAEAELARAREDLTAERERRVADAERFRQTLESFRASAEEAVAAEQAAAGRLGTDLREAHEALDAEKAARAEMESQLEPLRERVAALEQSAAEVDGMRAELQKARAAVAEAESLRAALEDAEGERRSALAELAAVRGALDEARADAERLLGHLMPGNESSDAG